MAENGSKTTASTYTNKKGVQRVQVSFDASKLNSDGTIDKPLLAEITAATKASRKA